MVWTGIFETPVSASQLGKDIDSHQQTKGIGHVTYSKYAGCMYIKSVEMLVCRRMERSQRFIDDYR